MMGTAYPSLVCRGLLGMSPGWSGCLHLMAPMYVYMEVVSRSDEATHSWIETSTRRPLPLMRAPYSPIRAAPAALTPALNCA